MYAWEKFTNILSKPWTSVIEAGRLPNNLLSNFANSKPAHECSDAHIFLWYSDESSYIYQLCFSSVYTYFVLIQVGPSDTVKWSEADSGGDYQTSESREAASILQECGDRQVLIVTKYQLSNNEKELSRSFKVLVPYDTLRETLMVLVAFPVSAQIQ